MCLKAGDVVPLSEARKRANQKYNEKTYERVQVVIRKGEKAVIQAHATSRGESVNGFLNRAIKETIERDNG